MVMVSGILLVFGDGVDAVMAVMALVLKLEVQDPILMGSKYNILMLFPLQNVEASNTTGKHRVLWMNLVTFSHCRLK